MSTKKRLMERIGRRMDMINESLPPDDGVTFSVFEVMEILFEIEGFNPKDSNPNPSDEEIKQIFEDKEIHTTKFKIRDAYQNALAKKRGWRGTGGAPEGAYY